MNINGIAQKSFSLGLIVAFSGWLSVSEVKAQVGIAKLDVYPADVQLLTQRDSQELIVVATRDDDVTLDVTSQVKWTVADDKLVNLSGNLLKPVADGDTKLTVEFSGHQVEVPISVKDATTERDVSFKTDVMAVFLRAGCNTGSCHGSARGKDGFNLSIFGFDPDGDHHRITRENSVRRINLAFPEASLLIEKAIGAVPHTGGKQFDKGSEHYETIYRWLSAGAPKDPGEVPTCDKVEIYPPKAVLEGEGTTQQFIVKAFFSDGSTRDVTNLTMFSSSNGNSAPITKDGLVTAGSRGEAFVMARYDVHTVGSQTVILPTELKYEQPKVTGNYIDELVGAKLHKLRILPSEVCTDEEYLRRTSIDITGHLPTAEEYQLFMADTSADKRSQLVNRLLERKEFSEIWAMKWAQILMIKSVNNQVSYKSAFLYNNWLTEKIANEVPLDQMVREMLSASGGTFSNPATNFYQIETDTLKTAENVAQVFMGIRTQCAQCHNHPFDRWTMDDYYSFAAFFAQIGRKTGEDYRERIIYNRSSGDVRHLVGNKVMAPKFLGGAIPDTKGRDRRELLAEWLTSSENELFSTSVANRIWEHFTGVGIIDPVDDIRVSNPPSNPELFKTLGAKLTEYKFDFKALVRDICASEAYQRSTVPNDTNRQDTKNFSYAQVRRIPAEQLLDCISQSTNTQDKFKGLPLGAKAVQIADGTTSNYFLTTFGRSERETACACEATTSPTLSQSLHMINGSTSQGKIAQGKLVATWTTEGATSEQVIEKIFIRCLSRKPNEEEISRLMGVVEQDENVKQGLEDVFWAVLNSREYLFNH